VSVRQTLASPWRRRSFASAGRAARESSFVLLPGLWQQRARLRHGAAATQGGTPRERCRRGRSHGDTAICGHGDVAMFLADAGNPVGHAGD
jgi:hypothetical protein